MENPEKTPLKYSTWESTKAVWSTIIWMICIGVAALIMISIQFADGNSDAGAITKTKSNADTVAKGGAKIINQVKIKTGDNNTAKDKGNVVANNNPKTESNTNTVNKVNPTTVKASIPDTLYVLGAAFLIAGASFCSGGLIGFLFGIPKMSQNDNQGKAQDANNKAHIIQNDNLVQISDWLTKIIVGVGLTQLYNIPGFLNKIGKAFSPVFGDSDVKTQKIAVICILLYFLTLGFFAVYLWTSLFFVRLLNSLNDQLQKKLDEQAAVPEQVKVEPGKV